MRCKATGSIISCLALFFNQGFYTLAGFLSSAFDSELSTVLIHIGRLLRFRRLARQRFLPLRRKQGKLLRSVKRRPAPTALA